ncbi:uncharacterized protein [Macrobrachium rosenbergii]|uniref:uncharacterized protein n=1 Tax=Macrobrachium rosenbergii TaxID=79674 RepID=UPI0034D6FF77
MDKKFDNLVSTVAQIGASVRVILDKANEDHSASVGASASVSVVEEVATHPTDAPRWSSLPNSPAPGRRQTVSPREVGGVCPQVVASSAEPVAISQVSATKCWKGVQLDYTLSSSGLDSEPKGHGRHFQESSRPLKRHVADVHPVAPRKCHKDQEPSCSYWDDRELPLARKRPLAPKRQLTHKRALGPPCPIGSELPVAHKHAAVSVCAVAPYIPLAPSSLALEYESEASDSDVSIAAGQLALPPSVSQIPKAVSSASASASEDSSLLPIYQRLDNLMELLKKPTSLKPEELQQDLVLSAVSSTEEKPEPEQPLSAYA